MVGLLAKILLLSSDQMMSYETNFSGVSRNLISECGSLCVTVHGVIG